MTDGYSHIEQVYAQTKHLTPNTYTHFSAKQLLDPTFSDILDFR